MEEQSPDYNGKQERVNTSCNVEHTKPSENTYLKSKVPCPLSSKRYSASKSKSKGSPTSEIQAADCPPTPDVVGWELLLIAEGAKRGSPTGSIAVVMLKNLKEENKEKVLSEREFSGKF
jgi:hypothetical protein